MYRFLFSLLVLSLLAIAVSFSAIAQTSCYQHERAYVVAGMNIRANPTTSSAVVATARAGDSFAVTDSRRAGGWCWLEIARGWLAKTGRVRTSATPAATNSEFTSQPQQQSNIDNCCFVNQTCTSQDDWTNGYWAFQRNECPLGSSARPVSVSQPQNDPPPTRGEGGLQPITASATFYEWLGEGEFTTATVPLSAGTWNLNVNTAATTLAYAESPGERCLSWGRSRALVASKRHNIFGGNNEAVGQFTVRYECRVRFYIWAPRHRWSLKVQKL